MDEPHGRHPDEENPFAGPDADQQALRSASSRSVISFTSIAVGLTIVAGILLIAASAYNVSLWKDGARPPRELSLRILSMQMVLTLSLLLAIPYHGIATLVHLVRRRLPSMAMSIAGAVGAIFAIGFAMIYDQGSIFHQ